MPATVTHISPRLAAAQARNRTEQQARYQRALATIAERRARGEKTVTIGLRDLEALLCIAASTDRALADKAMAS